MTTATKNKAVKAPKGDDQITPMMAQFLDIKKAHEGYLLFYRMGDFYELFFDDAVKAAEALDITLTKRGRHLGEEIPMCGVPVHSADAYLARLIRKGFKVAVGEQMEDPAEAKKRGSKSVVRRDVVRLVTPGTLTEDVLLDARSHNYLASVAVAEGAIALAWLDISTGSFSVMSVTALTLDAELARVNPGEIIISDHLVDRPAGQDDVKSALENWSHILSPVPSQDFDSQRGERRLKELFGVAHLDGFGTFGRPALAACGGLICYLEETQKGQLPMLQPPAVMDGGGTMMIDSATRRNLELVQTLEGKRDGSLVSIIDRTVTGVGARLLTSRLAAPLTDAKAINRRIDVVACFVNNEPLGAELRKRLRRAPDAERALSRLGLERGGPRDLAAVRDCMAEAGRIRALLEEAAAKTRLEPLPEDLKTATLDLGAHHDLIGLLTRGLKEELPALMRDGGFIAKGYDAALDEFRMLRDESRRLIAALERKYVDLSGISGLKIKHNNVLGYHIDVKPNAAAALMEAPLNATFNHRQTLGNAVRFNTPELAELASKIAQADVKALAREMELYEALVEATLGQWEPVMKAAQALAQLDVATALANLALEAGYTRPVVDESATFAIEGGRHPVVERALARAGSETFVANDCDLSPANHLWLITGPNMAGKSTFLRQNALIAILAQMGSFVPASSAHIGAVDRLFSRVGASDDLARGRSTFMVEMVETAAILNQAGPKSLVILDEIGRGTATYDGLSIAWAAVEHLHEVNRCRALFATHYHELKALKSRLEALALHAMKVREWRGDVIFLHEVGPGSADRSYGIQVAKLAGLPPAVVARAEQVLANLEKGERSGGSRELAEDLPLFAAVAAQAKRGHEPEISALEQALDEAHPDELTPKEALEFLYKLKTLRNSG